jgi:hypothetical protein
MSARGWAFLTVVARASQPMRITTGGICAERSRDSRSNVPSAEPGVVLAYDHQHPHQYPACAGWRQKSSQTPGGELGRAGVAGPLAIVPDAAVGD